jgi:phosphoglycolate phosphatase-like HAD superfamily hydrolase
MRLAVFDLDGTLADTLAVDHRCFVDAFRLEHGIDFTDDDWSNYRQTTDSGITPEVLERHLGRPSTAAEVERHKQRFIELLERASAAEPDGFREVAGAADLLAALAARPDWRVVVATGSWRDSARLKLRLAGLDRFGLPLASADDAETREEIVAHGVALADGGGPFEGTVLIGDKPWDLAAARHFGFGFVGVASSSRQRLRAAGAECVFDDWRATSAVLSELRERAVAGSR